MSDKITVDIPLKAEFYDVDSMKVVWHGNYVKYYEQARCALLDLIGYGYREMEEAGIAWPVVKLEIKYIKPILFSQEFRIKAILDDYENRLKISFIIYDEISGEILNKGSTVQMAVDMETEKSMLVSPSHLIELINRYLDGNKVPV